MEKILALVSIGVNPLPPNTPEGNHGGSQQARRRLGKTQFPSERDHTKTKSSQPGDLLKTQD